MNDKELLKLLGLDDKTITLNLNDEYLQTIIKNKKRTNFH